MSSSSQSLELLFTFLSRSYATIETNFYKIPGSAVVARYVKSSHQNDPGRTVLEVILIIFAIRTLLQSRTRGDQAGKHFIKFDEKVRARLYSSAAANSLLAASYRKSTNWWTSGHLSLSRSL